MSVKFLSAILGPEMGASILWTPGKMRSFCRKKTMSIKFRVLGGGLFGFFWGGGSADFIFMGARIFLTLYGIFSLRCPVLACCDQQAPYACLCSLRWPHPRASGVSLCLRRLRNSLEASSWARSSPQLKYPFRITLSYEETQATAEVSLAVLQASSSTGPCAVRRS